jgi:RES domain/HEPN/RES N-terminal domain 1
MACCEKCFAHAFLREQIREKSTERGQCDYCGSEEIPLIDPEVLSEFIQNMLSMYRVPEDSRLGAGSPLIQLVQDNWEVFNDELLGEDAQVELLEEIANSDWDDDDGEPMLDARASYVVGGTFHTSHTEAWSDFADKVREKPGEHLPFHEYFEENFNLAAVTVPAGTLLYRARPGCEVGKYRENSPYRGVDIGAPPPESVKKPGRANEVAEVVLYCPDDELTTVAECRRPRGYLVSVCSVSLKRDARILDLTISLEAINPFTTESLLYECEVRGLLAAFGEEMSRPLERDDDESHYIPSQRLVHYVRDAKYDGVRYPSALNPQGKNLVFFDPTIAEIGDSKLVRITEANLKYEIEDSRTTEERLQGMFGMKRDMPRAGE